MMENCNRGNPLILRICQPILGDESVLYPSWPPGEGNDVQTSLWPGGDRGFGLAVQGTIHPQCTTLQEAAILSKVLCLLQTCIIATRTFLINKSFSK